jgi:hypothetical protein
MEWLHRLLLDASLMINKKKSNERQRTIIVCQDERQKEE